jgi:hypothetical protein
MHTQQARITGDCRWYAPARDLTCYTPEAIRSALTRLEDELVTSWSEDELGLAANALASFCSEECIVGTQTVEEALQKSGLLDLPFTLRQKIFASIAESLLGAFWFGIRTATTVKPDGQVDMTQYDPALLRRRAERACKLFGMPVWRRRLTILWLRVLRRFGMVKED